MILHGDGKLGSDVKANMPFIPTTSNDLKPINNDRAFQIVTTIHPELTNISFSFRNILFQKTKTIRLLYIHNL